MGKNKIEGVLRGTSSASFNWSYLRGSPTVHASYWGVSDPVEYRHRIALAQLADTLLIKDKLLLGDSGTGLAQVFHAFGPTLAIEVLRLGRVIGLTVPGKNTTVYQSLCHRSTEEMPELLNHLLKDETFYIRPRSEKERDRYIQTALANTLEIPSSEHERVKKIATDVSQNWLEQRGRLFLDLWYTPYIYSRVTAHVKPTVEQLEQLIEEGAYLIACKLAQAWYSGVAHSLFERDEQNFLYAVSKVIGNTSNRYSDASPEGLHNILNYERLPRPGLLVMHGLWGPRQVFECITSPEAEHLRAWMKRVKSGNFFLEYIGSLGALPERKAWVRWLRFGVVTALSSGFSFALSQDPILASALGIGAGAVDTAYGDKAAEKVFPQWYPRIWTERHARDVRMTTNHTEQEH